MNFVWLCVYDIILYKVSEENKVMLLPGYLLDLDETKETSNDYLAMSRNP